METGTKLHKLFSIGNRGFHHDRLVQNLMPNTATYTKQIDNIVVTGAYDDLKVNVRDAIRTTSIIELKTTTKKVLLAGEINCAIRQLKLYMWLLKDNLAILNYPLDTYSYVYLLDQKTRSITTTIPVMYDDGIEDWIRSVTSIIKDLNRAKPSSYVYCRACPIQTREMCYVYQRRMKVKQEWVDTGNQ